MISRRRFTASALLATAASALPRLAAAAPLPGAGWRRFAVTTRVALAETSGPAQAWLPLPGFSQPDWARPEGDSWTVSPNGRAERAGAHGADLLHVRWDAGPRTVEVTSVVSTRDRAAGAADFRLVLPEAERAFCLAGSAAAPTDGIVKATADRITAGATSDAACARAIYDWVVAHTFRDPAVRGCGDGDIVRMLQSGVLGGKCADLNPLFVALARASGLPAREIYGVRVAPSRLGYKSLGPATPTVTKAQHCRSEVFLTGLGWTAMDPADVRKVMLEEAPGGLPLDDPKVAAARARLFGAWEGNWVPFNAASDVALPGRDASPVNFLMYPQVETAAGMLDCYDPDAVRYTITAQELAI